MVIKYTYRLIFAVMTYFLELLNVRFSKLDLANWI